MNLLDGVYGLYVFTAITLNLQFKMYNYNSIFYIPISILSFLLSVTIAFL